MTQVLPPKKEVVLALLERSNVDVYLDPRADGVIVPPQFRKEPRLILKIGLNMPLPIPDLRVDEDSMSCTLSFSRTPFYCVVPWSSVFAMVGEDGRGMVWPDDVPRELAMRVVDERRPPADRESSPHRLSSVDPPREPLRAAGGRGKSKLAESSLSEDERARRPNANNSKKSAGKKKQGPVLVAVPSPSPATTSPASASTTGEAKTDKPTDESDKADPQDLVDAFPADDESTNKHAERKTSTANPRPKRELPPYLRIVK
ncbi:MAG: ClpXP protease specificity-enhancing factor SspB [Polyangiaceae bacterium]|nr:ClpXP protease specificity-enhancing factor SspB [Polyangiaceae bacterium]